MTRLAVEPTEVSDETIAFDVIAKVGPGDIYLGEDHTLAHFRELWLPKVLSWEGRDAWEEAGSKTLSQRARDKVFEVWANHTVERLPDDVLAGMRAVIEARRAIVPPE
jgi:trimethylamine--corrinoid protein Co-methyltransferase